jgi:sulfotransferase 6B1
LQMSREQAVQQVIEAVQPKKSPTFRKGRSGEWRNYFKEEHKQQFKQVTGDLLVQMGYEQDDNW